MSGNGERLTCSNFIFASCSLRTSSSLTLHHCVNSQNCLSDHPFPCRFGFSCRNKASGCKFLHPEESSVVPLGKDFPLNRACKHGASCTNAKCHFAHPLGRVRVVRKQNTVLATHSLDLEELDKPRPLDLSSAPASATKFLFQGEFAFFFTRKSRLCAWCGGGGGRGGSRGSRALDQESNGAFLWGKD